MNYFEDKENIAENIKYYRKKKAWSQEKLAEKVGCHRTYIGGIEQMRLNPTVESLSRIAQTLNVTLVMLLIHPNERQVLDKLTEIFHYSIVKIGEDK